jgi:hypothetical protein
MAPEGCRAAWCDYDYEHEHGIEAIKKTCTAIIVQVFFCFWLKSVDINRGDMKIFFFKW